MSGVDNLDDVASDHFAVLCRAVNEFMMFLVCFPGTFCQELTKEWLLSLSICLHPSDYSLSPATAITARTLSTAYFISQTSVLSKHVITSVPSHPMNESETRRWLATIAVPSLVHRTSNRNLTRQSCVFAWKRHLAGSSTRQNRSQTLLEQTLPISLVR